MDTDHAQDSDAVATEGDGVPRIPAVVDWAAGALLALGGMALVLGGATVLVAVDRPLVATAIAEGARDTAVLAEAAVVDVALTTGTWTGWGLLFTGALMVGGAIAYVVRRRRARSRGTAGEPGEDFLANAVVGAVVSVVLGFVPFSPAVGGAVAGYFERGEGERVIGVGALSGVLAASPLLAIAAFALGGVAVGLFGVGRAGLGVVVVLAALFSLMVIVTVGAALGALGGYVGSRLADD